MALPIQETWLAEALSDSSASSQSFVLRKTESERRRALPLPQDPLWVRIQNSDESAFVELVATIVPALLRYAERQLDNTAHAEDVVQEIMARLWSRRETLQVNTTLRAYLFTSVRNDITNLRKHGRIAQAHAREILQSPPETPVYDVISQVTADQLLEYLPPRRREAVELRYLGQMSFAEVAAVLGTTKVNAERLVARSLETLRALVRDWEAK